MKISKKLIFMMSCLFFLIAFFLAPAYAVIRVNDNFTGTLIITDPNATDPEKMIIMVEAGKPIPPIPSGAILEVMNGEFTVTTEPGDSVDITVLDHELTVKDGSSVTVKAGESEGVVIAVKGSEVVMDPLGKENAINEGDRFPIKLTAFSDKPTEVLEDAGTPPSDNNPPTDSRNMETSPAGQ